MRGVLQPVLDQLAVGFRVMHGFSSGTVVHNIAKDDDGRALIALYVGDFDPSGMYMSEEDLPKRLAEYGGNHVTVQRIALTRPSGARPALVPGRRQEERPTPQVVRRQLWATLLGARRHGPERSARLRRAGDRQADRARSVATLRDRQQGRTGVAQDRP